MASITKTMEVSRKRQRSTHGIPHQRRCMRSPIRITDIGVDCLAHVFSSLDLKELAKVAEVSHQFRDAANYVFRSRYSQKTIGIMHYGFFPNNYEVKDKQLILQDSKTVLQVLRCFGRSIFDIYFVNIWGLYGALVTPQFKRYYDKILFHINQHCADSLKKISVDPVTKGFDEMCTKPFANAENVSLTVDNLDIVSLNRIFPKMKHLSIDWHLPLYQSDNRPITIPEHYPHLQHLHFNLNKKNSVSDSFFKKTILLNKQIESLSICARRSLYDDFKTIHLPYVKDFRYQEFDFCVPCQKSIPFKFDALQSLTVNYINVQYLKNYHNFVKRHPSIEKLIFYAGERTVFADLENGILSKSKSLQFLTSLKEIRVETGVNFSIGHVMKYMLDIETLKCFSFFCSSSDDYIKQCCGNGWEIKHLPTSDLLKRILPKDPFIKLIRKI